MSPFFVTATSGWAATAMIVVTLMLPYMLRRTAGAGFRDRIQAHVWIGFAIVAAAATHVAIGLDPAVFTSAQGDGIIFAVAAAIALAAQVLFGLKLNHTVTATTRRMHFRGMVLIVAAVAGHIFFNSPLF